MPHWVYCQSAAAGTAEAVQAAAASAAALQAAPTLSGPSSPRRTVETPTMSFVVLLIARICPAPSCRDDDAIRGPS